MKKEQLLKSFEYMAEKIPCNLYWLDLDLKILGMNKKTLLSIGAISLQHVLGKTVHHIYPKYIADDLTKHFTQVLDTQIDITQEHIIKDMTTGKLRIYVDTVSPIVDESNKLIGVIGSSVEVTAERETEKLTLENIKLESQNKFTQVLLEKLAAEAKAEQLRLENETYLAQKKEQAKFLSFIDKIQRDIQNYKVEALTEQIGIKPKISNSDKQIRLTKRELDVLYYLSLNKSPKDISQIITIIENKPVSDSTINAIINKKLYPKFEVFNIGQLVEKAIMLNQIPFLLDNSDHK